MNGKLTSPLHWHIVAAAAALVAISLAARADDTVIYKWVDKNGSVSYSQDKPPEADAKNVTTISVPTLPPDQQRAANRTLSQLAQATDAEYKAKKKRQQAADARIDAALKRLQAAERHLAAGTTPTGYDRVGMVNGRSRLRDSYFDRVAQLEANVTAARKNLDDAYASRDKY